jgi:hypothetical protein
MRILLLMALAALIASPLAGCSDAVDDAPTDPAYRWEPEARRFFEDYCVRCHGPGHPGGDYARYDDVAADASPMRCGLAPAELDGCDPPMPEPRTFPTGPRPPEAEVQQALEWLDAGLPR